MLAPQVTEQYGGAPRNGQRIPARRADRLARDAKSLGAGNYIGGSLRLAGQNVARLILAEEEGMQRDLRCEIY